MAEVAFAFLAMAAVAFAGFLAGRLFDRTRFPDVPVLLALGLILGPLNRAAVAQGWGIQALADALEPAQLRSTAPFIAALALVVLMFDSGMELDFVAFRRSLGPATLHTLPILLLTTGGVTVVGHWVLGMPYLVAAAFGIAIVNVDQAVSASVLQRMRLAEDLRSIYFVEMALYDLLAIPVLVGLLQYAEGAQAGVSLGVFLRGLAAMVSVSALVGLGGGIPWLFALRGLQGHPHSYMLTFATTLAVYGVSELLGGSGVMSILLFGLLVGNRTQLLRRFAHLRDVGIEHEKVQTFHDEITFVARTLYFLFLGASFSGGAGTKWPVRTLLLGNGSWVVPLGAVLLVGTLVATRYVPIRLMALRHPRRLALFPVFGRGLDTAVLATLPFLATAYVPGGLYYDLFSPWETIVVDLALFVILLTILASSLLVFLQERNVRAPNEKTKRST